MVKATNKIGAKKSNAQPSFPCTLIGPDPIELTKDLPSFKIIDSTAVDLSIATKSQSNNNTVVEYIWNKGTDSNVIDEAIENETSANYIAVTPGWYQASAKATLNRETKTLGSTVCKVTFKPALPPVDYDDVAKAAMRPDGIPGFNDSVVTLKVVVGSVLPEGFEDYSTELFSEGLTYFWTKQKADEVPVLITEQDVKDGLITGSINSPELVVNNPQGYDNYMFKCFITNTLNGKTITTSANEALAFLVS